MYDLRAAPQVNVYQCTCCFNLFCCHGAVVCVFADATGHASIAKTSSWFSNVLRGRSQTLRDTTTTHAHNHLLSSDSGKSLPAPPRKKVPDAHRARMRDGVASLKRVSTESDK